MLHRCRVQGLADFVQPGFARLAVAGRRAHLDEFMRLEIAFYFQDHGGRQAVVADHDDRVKRVRQGFERAALDGG